MLPRPDMRGPDAPKDLGIYQLTTEAIPSAHIYMEAQIFTPDSRRLVLHRSANAHGDPWDDAHHQFLLCDLDNAGALSPLTTERAAKAPSLSPDGAWMYYLLDRTFPGGGDFELKRVRLDGTGRETLLTVDGPIPGTTQRVSSLYVLSTISPDGKRLATACYLGDGNTPNAPWGALVFDLQKGGVALIELGPTFCNLHPQYCRSLDPARAHDLMIQDNHGCDLDAQGKVLKLVSGDGADIHVIRDDGTDWRDLPWGRDGDEHCVGHQCWRGRDYAAITSAGVRSTGALDLIQGVPMPHVGHIGRNVAGGARLDLSRDFKPARFSHFGTDIAGRRIVSDYYHADKRTNVVAADFPVDPAGALRNLRVLLTPQPPQEKSRHMHPFCSPDGTMAFFNSSESGHLQAYMARGF
jgi:hypothetical protein